MSGVMSPASTPAPATERNTPAPTLVMQPGASQFGQFRLTTFVDANPDPRKMQAGKRKSACGAGSATQSPVVRPSSVPVGVDKGLNGMNNGDMNIPITANGNGTGNNETEHLAVSAAPAAAPAHRRTASAAANKIPTGQHNGFGVLDLKPPLPPVGQGKLGQHRDGRVRNPVPRKLKGKTDMRNGNFSVMHMDMSAHSGDKSTETRGEAAQRTSENTAKAAREALREKAGGGGGVKRRRVDGQGGWEPILSQASQTGALQSGGGGNVLLAPAAPPPPKEIVHRTEGMTPEEVKYEQARLLTLLRSLNPLAVVDQMCTALAFFGGIPGAPPPTANGGSFPESEDANGNGASFVGWLSEIFPDPQRRMWSCTRVVVREESVVMGKRPRGRPKGSKASKVRKDKGIKKIRKDGLANNAARPGAEDGDDPADDDWVDILEAAGEGGPSGGNAQPDGGAFMDLDGADGTPSQEAGKRRVGRPRGSQNKEKERGADGDEIPSVDVFSLSSPSEPQQNHIRGGGNAIFEHQSVSEQQAKRKPGRPPGSKTKPKEGDAAPTPKGTKVKAAKEGPTTARAKSVVDGSIPSGLAADERAILEAYRKNKALAGPEKPEDPMRKKRKSRAKPKATADGGQGENGEQDAQAGDTPTMIAQQLNSQPQVQPTPTQSTTAVPPPPPKRQRKGKEPVIPNAAAAKATNNNIDPTLQSTPLSASPRLSQTKAQSQPQKRTTQQPARSMSASHTQQNPFASPPMNNMNSAMMSIESLMPTSTQQGGGAGRTAQGLEAHYERFANQEPQSQSPNTYSLGGQLSQPHNQRASPAVPQGKQRTSSQTQHRAGMTGSPQKSAMGRVASTAGVSNSGMYYGQNQAQGQQQQQQGQRHIPSQSAGYGYATSAGMGNQQGSRSNSYNLDAFGGRSSINPSLSQLPSSSGTNQHQHQRGNSGYGVQNQNQGYFDGGNIQGAGYVDLPALETGMGGGGGGYGLPSSTGGRSASYSAGGMGGNMAGGLFGTEQQGPGISESEMRERLLRGIGRR